MHFLALAMLAMLVTGCATTDSGRISSRTTTTPLHDFNLASTAIPPVLREARKQAYAMPVDASCAGLTDEIQRLDDVLGPDIDMKPDDSNAGDVVADAATNALQGVLDGLVPFRHWIRRLSGADQHTRDIAAAIAAGSARRSFIKGLRQMQPCPA